jgi:hypothetical protein
VRSSYVDQSEGDAVAAVVTEFSRIGARVGSLSRRDIRAAVNLGLREVTNGAVHVTYDHCRVA